MSSFTDAQARRAPIIETRERVQLRHPGNFLVVQHVDSGVLLRVAALENNTPKPEVDAWLARLADMHFAVVPHAQQRFVMPDGSEARLLNPVFWQLPILGEDGTAGHCASCVNWTQKANDVSRCAVIGAPTPIEFGCLANYERKRESDEVSTLIQ